ncbi:chemotaxis protein CheA [Simiduia sp. 21SJ11W-1]|uniref:chemotaxis protein CheA n=1 Tax=Simiduia sp. 21SJ11W-1 TaxID=2909669 RepID=UPI0020A00738|nr:chemotaxis protein CheA [Simiduia sp. 21SJ11W-1]UTA47692.1 chemotaxis protein CheA [Simiduia sp. 21SJ11W-1]
MSIDLKQFHQTFFEESLEGLDVMEQSLLQVQNEDGDNPELINTIFRAAHSIKGGSGTFGFADIAEFTHLLETLLDEARDGKRTLDTEAIDLLLKSTDCLRAMVAGHMADAPAAANITDELAAGFKKLLAQAPGAAGAPQAAPTPSSTPSESSSTRVWNISFIPNRDILLSGNEPARIFRELAELGECLALADESQLPELNLLTPDECFLQWQLWLRTAAAEADIREVFEWVIDDCTLTVRQAADAEWPGEDAQADTPVRAQNNSEQSAVSEVTAPAQAATAQATDAQAKATSPAASPPQGPKKAAPAAEPAQAVASPQSSSIRVGIDKVDSLINLVGELVITQSMLSELGNDFTMDRVDRLNNGLEQLMQNTRELQESVMRIRMLPISFAFNRFPRMIRDLSQKTGKQVELKLSGEQTELDKTVMEQISDPLVHLVRNAVDHGLEPPAEREQAGKAATGNLHLNAFHQGGNIVIEISDDGRGINGERVLQKAIEKGLVPEGTELSQQQIFDLIFEPGFSTAATVSDISGRGVGMDVVKRNIKSLGGRIEVISAQGKGSTFRVHLPLTLAILDGQLVRVGGETYVIPLVTIVESLQMQPDSINYVSGNIPMYRLREDNVPLVAMNQLFDVETDPTAVDNQLLVVVEADGQKLGLRIDDLLAQQQVVIKSLESNYKRIEGVSGATILGDGSVALILDVTGIMNLALSQRGSNPRAA